MNEEECEKLSRITWKLSSMTFVLNACCENYEQDIKEFSKITEFTRILHGVSEELYDLL